MSAIMAAPEHEDRRHFGRRWRRRLLWLTLLTAAAWFLLTAYYFRQDLNMNLRLLWENRGYAAQEYVPALADLVESPPEAVSIEAVLRGKVPRPIAVEIGVGDVLVGHAVRVLRSIVPLVVAPALALLVGGYVAAGIGGRLLALVSPTEFRRIWPAIIIPVLFAFSVGAVFGAAAYRYREQITSLLGL